LNRPLNRNQLRKKLKRRITKKDLDMHNTPFMTKFLTETGKLYNRYQTRLETNVHRRMSKVVKQMRHQFLIPFVGLIKPTDKIPYG
jgi:ribosomal protein S18